MGLAHHRRTAALLVVILASTPVSAILAGCGERLVSAPEDEKPSAFEKAPSAPTTGFPTPQKAVEAWYRALGADEMSALKPVSSPDFADILEPAMFEGRAKVTTYTITGTQIEGDQGTVEVIETQAGKPSGKASCDVMKWPKGWIVSGFNPSRGERDKPLTAP